MLIPQTITADILRKPLLPETFWLQRHRTPIEESFVQIVVRECMQKLMDALWSSKQHPTIQVVWLAPQQAPDTEAGIRSSEVKIRQLVETGNISGARRELLTIPKGTSKQLDKWKRLLAEPVIKEGRPASGQGMSLDLFWLQNHSERYKGQWVALKKGQLIGSNESRISLESLLTADQLEGATFLKVGQ